MVMQLGLTTAAFVFAGKIFGLTLCSTRCSTKTMDLDDRSNLVCMAGIALDLQGQQHSAACSVVGECHRREVSFEFLCARLD